MESNPALPGTWKLVSCFMEDVETGERTAIWGEHPNGYLVLTSERRWLVVQTAEGRKAPKTEDDQAAAFRSMLAYSGRYRTDGDRIIIDVDISWDESWNGTEQIRHYRLQEDQLRIEAAPQPSANFGGKVMRGVLLWTRDR